MTRRRNPFGLRARITILVTLGAALLAGGVAGITYYSVRNSVLSQQVSTLTHETLASALLLRQDLQLPTADYPELLNSTAPSGGMDSLLYESHHWYSSSSRYIPPRPLPAQLQSDAISGSPSDETIVIDGSPTFAVGVPIAAAKATYFELFSLREPARTLHVLLTALLAAAIVVTLCGGLLGAWVASRSLRPLHEAAQAALAIAGGNLDTRLPTDSRADLAVLTSAFNRMADRLQERVQREVSFTSDVNHELRSPLTTLAASLSVLEGRRAELPERSRQALDLLSAEVRRFRRLVDDLLEISRLDSGLSDLSLTEVSLGDLVTRSVAATPNQVPVEVVDGAVEKRVLIDKRRFERVVANLLDNAQHYAGGATRVTVSADGEVARIAVEDHGPGIPEQERGRIFDRFSRGASGRRRGLGEGTGLGLAIVADHTRVLGGTVFVEQNDGQGARFVVELPLVAEADRDGDDMGDAL